MTAKAIPLILMLVPPLTSDPRQSNTVNMAESGIRRVATKKPLPIYPLESVAKKSSGVAVAAIASNVDGQLASVTVLEAPDAAIATAVRDALLGWNIPPASITGRPQPYGIRGKITFYFQIVNGRGRVANPEDLPGGPKPEPVGGPPASPPGVRGGDPPLRVVTHDESPAEEIDEAALARLLAASPRPILLDIRERPEFKRAHRDGAINIPRDELPVRGWIEVDRTKPVVIDCSRAETSQCQQAARVLLRGPKPVRVLILVP